MKAFKGMESWNRAFHFIVHEIATNGNAQQDTCNFVEVTKLEGRNFYPKVGSNAGKKHLQQLRRAIILLPGVKQRLLGIFHLRPKLASSKGSS